MTDTNTFFLSDVPFTSLRNRSPFFKSHTGKVGRIVRIDGSYKGADPEVFLSIQWDSVEELSFVLWPDECTKLPVDMDVVGRYLQPYCDAQIQLLEKQIEFYKRVGDGNPHRIGSLQWATHKQTSTEKVNVVEELPSR